MLKSYDGNLFQVFDEDIGVEGYYNIIRESLFSNPDPDDFVAAIYQARQRIYRKGAIFSRVRKLSVAEFNKFSTEGINVSEIYPPKPDKTSIPQGRFNSAGKRVMYLADHPLIAMKECDVNKGDFFLLSNFSLSKDMNFIEIVSNKDQFSGLVYELLQTKDKRFYPVLNLRDPHKLLPHIIHTLSDRPVSSTTELSTAKFALALADNIAYLY